MECEVLHWYDLIGDTGKPTQAVVLGKIKRFQVASVFLTPVKRYNVNLALMSRKNLYWIHKIK